jgi:hypothetical protein
LLRTAAWIGRFVTKVLLDRMVVGVNGEVRGMVQNGPEIGGSASFEDGCLDVQATNEAAAAKMVISTGFEEEPLSQRLGLWGLADPDELEDETGGDGVPLLVDEREVNLVPQGGQIVGIAV